MTRNSTHLQTFFIVQQYLVIGMKCQSSLNNNWGMQASVNWRRVTTIILILGSIPEKSHSLASGKLWLEDLTVPYHGIISMWLISLPALRNMSRA